MGFLTTFTVYNDGIDQIENHPKEFGKKVCEAMRRNEVHTFGVGNYANLVNVQKPRHADDCTIYVHSGNTVSEMNAYSEDTGKLIESHEVFFMKMLTDIEYHLKELKRRYKLFSLIQNSK